LTSHAPLPSKDDVFQQAVEAYEAGDKPRAVQYWETLAVQGHNKSQSLLAKVYGNGDGVPVDEWGGFCWHFLSTKSDAASFQHWLGDMYFKGTGVIQNYDAAANCYENAADHGCSASAYKLSGMYAEGTGVSQSYKTAVKWCKVSALQRDTEAMYQLGQYYMQGMGVHKDWQLALKWFTAAAEQGSLNAPVEIGVIHSNGFGVPKDLILGYMWIKIGLLRVLDELNGLEQLPGSDKAAIGNDNKVVLKIKDDLSVFKDETEEMLCEVATKLTQFQVQEAEALADKWMIEP
jgi:TPR repeat protein